MDLPVGLRLPGLRDLKSEEALYEDLVQRPRELVYFFEEACRDIAWIGGHGPLFSKLAEWLTDQFIKDNLAIELAERAAAAVRQAHRTALPFMPKDIRVSLEGNTLEINSLLFGMGSAFLHDLLRRECILTGGNKVALESGSYATLQDAVEYLQTEKVENLWRKDQTQVLQEFEEAADWELHGLMKECAEILKRYIHKGNIKKLMHLAYDGGWQELFDECLLFINRQNYGISFRPAALPLVCLEIEEYRDEGIDIINEFGDWLTHLRFAGRTVYEPQFVEILRKAPRLVGLDISGSDRQSDYFTELPPQILELNLSMCPWLNDRFIEKLSGLCPRLEKLDLGSNSQITYNGFVNLHFLERLMALEVPRCHQIGNDELLIILQSCPGLRSLNLEECDRIGEEGFSRIAALLPELASLNLSRTNIGDSALVSIVENCKNLRSLAIARCPDITETGLESARRFAHNQLYIEIT